MSPAYDSLVLVTRVKLRIIWREFIHSVRTTFEGKLAVVSAVAAPFLMKRLLVSNALPQADMNDDSGWVVLWIAHLFMMATVVLFVVARTARSLIVHRRDDALAQYPYARQGLAAFHLWGETVAANALVLLALFYLFYGPLVSRLAAQPVMGTLLHVIGHVVVTLALGAVAYLLTLRALERRPTWGRRIYDMASFPGVFTFVMIAAGPLFLVDLAPDRTGDLRSTFDDAVPFFPPVAGAIALGAAAPLVRTPSRIVLGEVQGVAIRRFKSVFGGRKTPPTRRVVHGARMFFLKDVLLGLLRSPQGFIRRQSVFLGTAGLASYLAWGLLQESLIGEGEAEALVVGLVVFLACAAAYLRGLGSLGSEGPALALLRPVVRPSELMSYKMVSVLASVVPAGLVYGAAGGALSQALDMRPGPLVTAGIGGLTATVAAAFAVSLAFLFPDFERRDVLVAGASRIGRYTFISLALHGAVVVAGLRWLTRSGMLPSSIFVPSLMTTAGVGVALTGVVMMLALRRFPHLEY
jgi:hypothetical protein